MTTDKKPRVIFMGTPDFAVPALTALHATFGVDAVVTVPDKPSGRGQKVQYSAVKVAAMALGIEEILQPESLRNEEFLRTLRQRQPDILCVIAFRILPESVYQLANIASFNVHASLLPKYRGAAPINHAIIKGESITGVTSFLLNDVVDTGTILLQKQTNILPMMTAGDLYTTLMPLAAECAVETVHGLCDSTLTPIVQNNEEHSLAPKVWRETSFVNWQLPAESVRNFIHGISPQPCAWTPWNDGNDVHQLRSTFKVQTVGTGSAKRDVVIPGADKRLKMYKARVVSKSEIIEQDLLAILQKTGSWVMTSSSWYVCCGVPAQGEYVALEEIQLPNKSIMKAEQFIRGWRGATSGSFFEDTHFFDPSNHHNS